MLSAKSLDNDEKTLPELIFDNVTFDWSKGKNAIRNCSFSIPGPGLWMIVGSNGSGKSTLFKLIAGLLQPSRGKISCTYKPALMFQNPDHQLLMPSCASDLLFSLPRNLLANERRERISNALQQVGMQGMQSRPIHTLSGGQKQRLALAGALARDSTLLLLDEPTALLDPLSQKSVLRIVRRLCERSARPLTALWITHRLDELEYADGAAIMKQGSLDAWEVENIFERVKTHLPGGGAER